MVEPDCVDKPKSFGHFDKEIKLFVIMFFTQKGHRVLFINRYNMALFVDAR